MRSVPEKTLEHWTSIYLSNRFPNGAMWWPAFGEDILAELPPMAASGPGKTLALELKTTWADGDNHVLDIDTRQLARYLHPPFGPPLPVYYVFPVPRWTGPLTSWPGRTPAASTGMTVAPPQWWRRAGGSHWFGDWLYVMSAQSLAAALPSTWRASGRARLFTLNGAHPVGPRPPWKNLFRRTPPANPVRWKDFWKAVTRGGPYDGVRWHTVADKVNQPDQVLVLHGDEERLWQLGPLLNQPRRELEQESISAVAVDVGGNERLALHIPESALT